MKTSFKTAQLLSHDTDFLKFLSIKDPANGCRIKKGNYSPCRIKLPVLGRFAKSHVVLRYKVGTSKVSNNTCTVALFNDHTYFYNGLSQRV